MSAPAPPRPSLNLDPKATPSKSFASLVIVGVFVIVAGLLLPRLLSLSPTQANDSPPATTPTRTIAEASPSNPAATPEAESGSSLLWLVAKLVFGLAMIAGVCIALARWSNRMPIATTPGVLNPVARLAIDSRCVVHLVVAGGRRLLVGTDAMGVKAILELPPR